jgi:hypothetical protein
MIWLVAIIFTAASFLLLASFGDKVRLSAADIANLARNAGFSGNDLQTAVAIALAESGGNPKNVGDKKLAPERGPSLGLWQINMGTKVHASEFAAYDVFDPQVNANLAFSLYRRAGNSFRDWSTFTQADPKTGRPYYQAHLSVAEIGVKA